MPQLDLNTLANGALREKLEIEFERVAANIADPNTSNKAKRVIHAKFTLEPDEDREFVLATIEVESKLAPTKPAPVKFLVGTEKDGRVVMEEHLSKHKNQLFIDKDGDLAEPTGKKVVQMDSQRTSNFR